MTDNIKQTFLSLVRLGIGHSVTVLPEEIDWETVHDLASRQGLSALVLDGAQALVDCGHQADAYPMEKALKKQWIAQVIQNFEWAYDDYRKQIAELARFYHEHGFKMMVLKGYGLSLNYPIPNHRPCGDIDIWLFGKYKEADAVLSQELGISIDASHPHHTVFHWNGHLVENHYDWISVYSHWTAPKIESIFKDLAMDDSWTVDIDGQKVYLPSPNLHALFLLRHASLHFNTSGVSIRQILDYGFFVEKHTKEIDWEWLVDALKRFKMSNFFACLNEICIEDLGFSAEVFPVEFRKSDIKNQVLEDSLLKNTEESIPMPNGLFPRVVYKYRHWKKSAWKRRISYDEGWLPSFWSTVRAHVLNPKSI